jgi:hypothetical protein|eukprot:COSAG01_NODE_1946_length_8829_cov_909.234937_10_plen_131_part_00
MRLLCVRQEGPAHLADVSVFCFGRHGCSIVGCQFGLGLLIGQGGEVMQGVIKASDCEALAGLSAEDVLREWNDADVTSCSTGGRPSPALPPAPHPFVTLLFWLGCTDAAARVLAARVSRENIVGQVGGSV